MKHVTILRHAKSRWDDNDLADFDRPLNDRGWKAARRIGRELKERKFRFDLVLASPAARVRETIDGIQEEFDFAAPIHFEPAIYLAGEERLLTLLRALPETVQRPLLIGHNPGLQYLLLELGEDNDGDPARRRIAHKFPTAALAVVELAAHRWQEIEAGTGRIAELIVPNEL